MRTLDAEAEAKARLFEIEEPEEINLAKEFQAKAKEY